MLLEMLMLLVCDDEKGEMLIIEQDAASYTHAAIDVTLSRLRRGCVRSYPLFLIAAWRRPDPAQQ